ncbi:MAG: hypothetical protein JXQ73_05300 [Phycisphaerae bacterium]|nr:hypothetical protein [Phycisphaerae bacterium]
MPKRIRRASIPSTMTEYSTSPSRLSSIMCAVLAIAAASGQAAPEDVDADPEFVFCCRADNDLYRVMGENGAVCPRYANAAEAVRQAPSGAGVLILADGYPKKKTEVDAALFEAAAGKKLRLYIEFPAMLPGATIGNPTYLKTGPYGAIVERTVVASDAFGPQLRKMRILMINDSHYLPVTADKPHLVLARVEGYDTAVYGLPKATHPILFEHPRTGALVATTKLSQFVSARYAPTEAWPWAWKMILEWLQPGKPAPLLKWTPTVRPMYSPRDALPDSAQRLSAQRGTEYYGKSRLYIHPSWPADTGIDPLPADWPVGDGTHGIGECYISKRIFNDGTQAVSRTVRADCNLEAAMGLACGAALLNDPAYKVTAQKLNDLVFFNSILCGGPRADPASPSYGLIGGSTQSPGLYWGDDNARALLSAIASAALLRSDRWSESIVRGVLANFRTTGLYGFRPQNIAEDKLQQVGWRPFYRSPHVDYCPHMEAWLWPVYLWLYEQSKFAPLLDRARNGSRMMMAAYPHWRLEANRVETERCRMLLPLAWLVRVDDTPEHRQWLETIAHYVIDLQDASGAIPQIPGHVVASNEDFGTGECALTHAAGDPATDALYAINFAFVGMHEAAAATGNPAYAESAARMADFFIRTQTRSERHPELDGTWYRSFDYRKWDYWGSDGDAGWGVWTNEIGWTHSWITTVLALRELKTSLWDLGKTVRVSGLFDTHRKTMLPDEELAERMKIDLAGPWSFLPDRKDEGLTAGYFAEGLDASSWRQVTVPIAFDQCGPDMDRYIGVGWFRRAVDVPEAMRGRRVTLRFQGINYNATVWVNGKQVGENHDAFLPFEISVGDVIQYGRNNLIVLRVDNIRQRAQFPLFEGWLGQGGFLREAALVASDPLSIEQVAIQAEPDAAGGRLCLKAFVVNHRSTSAQARLRVEVDEISGRSVGRLTSSVAEVRPGSSSELSIEAALADAKPWSPGQPNLYRAKVYLLEKDKPVDVATTRFGFRKVEVKDAKICLNGKPVLLLGFNRHEDSPRTGMAVDLEQARADFTAMKQIGCNYVRFCHYPHHPGELDLCDELGLLVMIESSMNEWGHVDHPDPGGGFSLTPQDAPLVVENGKRTIRKMVKRDRNHPCVILCSVGNESAEERTDVVAGNSELVEYGRRLDPTRLWTHVSNSFNKPGYEAFYRSDDVITINCYPTHHIKVDDTSLREKSPQSTRFMQEVTQKLHRLFPDKPIVLGEFGYPGGESGPRGAEIQAVATEAEFNGLTAPYVSGMSLWCYARHPWATGAGYAGNQLISPYGYVSRDRKTRFPAMTVVERMYKQRANQSDAGK